ncbi:MAG: hypothetical protein ACE5JO_04795 [Candidatus Binatia bacterium]
MLRDFLQIEEATLRSNLDAAPDIAAILERIASFYRRIEEGIRDTREARVEDRLVLICLFHESFKFWLSAVATLLRGHLTEFLPMIRGAIESAAYAHKIRRHPNLAEIWLRREERRGEFNAAFRRGGIERQLFPEDEPLVRTLWRSFNTASTFGVHSNRERLAFSLQARESPDGNLELGLLFGSTDLEMIRRCAGFCVTVAYRMLEVFRPCFEDITGLAVWTTEWAQLQAQIMPFLELARGGADENEVQG